MPKAVSDSKPSQWDFKRLRSPERLVVGQWSPGHLKDGDHSRPEYVARIRKCIHGRLKCVGCVCVCVWVCERDTHNSWTCPIDQESWLVMSRPNHVTSCPSQEAAFCPLYSQQCLVFKAVAPLRVGFFAAYCTVAAFACCNTTGGLSPVTHLNVCEAELYLTFMLWHRTGSKHNLIVDINA